MDAQYRIWNCSVQRTYVRRTSHEACKIRTSVPYKQTWRTLNNCIPQDSVRYNCLAMTWNQLLVPNSRDYTFPTAIICKKYISPIDFTLLSKRNAKSMCKASFRKMYFVLNILLVSISSKTSITKLWSSCLYRSCNRCNSCMNKILEPNMKQCVV